MSEKYQVELEVDRRRGVIYAHSMRTGRTMLRICRIEGELPLDLRDGLLDITGGRFEWVPDAPMGKAKVSAR